MPIARLSLGVVVGVWMTVAPVHAAAQKGRGGNPHTGGQKTTAAQGPKTTPATHGSPRASTTPKTHGNPHTSTTSTNKGAARTTGATTPSPTTTTTNPIAAKLQGKPLGKRIEKMLPNGMTLDAASAGFKNQGQFIAAVHVSQNLGIPFADLKATMLGMPPSTANPSPTGPMSLGQAIRRLRPTLDADTAVAKAQKQTDADLSGR
jgi:hypothetical protein